MKNDYDLDLAGLERVFARIQKTIHRQPDSVRYAMNGFLIALGTYVRVSSARGSPASASVLTRTRARRSARGAPRRTGAGEDKGACQ